MRGGGGERGGDAHRSISAGGGHRHPEGPGVRGEEAELKPCCVKPLPPSLMAPPRPPLRPAPWRMSKTAWFSASASWNTLPSPSLMAPPPSTQASTLEDERDSLAQRIRFLERQILSMREESRKWVRYAVPGGGDAVDAPPPFPSV